MADVTTSNYNSWYTLVGGVFTLVSSVDIQLKLLDINYASFISPTNLVLGTHVNIYYTKSCAVFYGIVTQSNQLNRTIDGKTRYEITLSEPADKLKNTYMLATDDAGYSGVYLQNTQKKKTIAGYIANFLEYTQSTFSGVTWTDVSGVVGITDTLPTGEKIPSMGFSACTVWSAMQRLLIDQFGYGIWFEYPSAISYHIKYGYNNNVFDKWPIPLEVKVIENSSNYKVDGVVVYGDTNDLKSPMGTTSIGSKIICYRYSGCQNQEELDSVATKIYADRSKNNSRYEINFPVTTDMLKVREGDLIHIIDNAIGMTDAEGYGIKDVRISGEKVTVGIGAAAVTIFDVLADRLSIIDGDILSYNTKTFESDNVTCAASMNGGSADLTQWGPSVISNFTLDCKQFFGELTMTPQITPPNTSTDGLLTCYILAAATSGNTVVTDTPTIIKILVDEDGNNIDADGKMGWWPWSWQWMEVEVSYVFKSGNVTGSQVSWDATWVGGASCDYTFLDDNTTQFSSSSKRTITHKWFMDQQDVVTIGHIEIAMQHAGAGSNITIQDLFIRCAVYYLGNTDDQYIPSNCIVNMKLDGVTSDWIEIYDSSKDLALYYNETTGIWKSYTMEELGINLDYTVGAHKALFRCKADGDVGCILTGEYLAFDELTRLIKDE